MSNSLQPHALWYQASLSFTISWNFLKFITIELMMLSNFLILCHPLLPSIFLSIRVFSSDSALHIRQAKYWSFSFSISSFNEWGFPCGSAGKESTCNVGDLGSIPGLGRSPGEQKGYPLQYSGLEISMDCE